MATTREKVTLGGVVLGLVGLGALGSCGFQKVFENRAPQVGAPASGETPTQTPTRTVIPVDPTRTPEPTRTVVPTPTRMPAVQGVDCSWNTRAVILGFPYIDNPTEMNTPRQANNIDIHIPGAIEFGEVVAMRKDNPADPNSLEREIARVHMVTKDGGYSVATLNLQTTSNTFGVTGPAVAVEFYFDNDTLQQNRNTGTMEKPRLRGVIDCGRTGVGWGGIVPTIEKVQQSLDDPRTKFKKIGTVVDQVRESLNAPSKSVSPLRDDATENRALVRKYIQKLRGGNP